MTSLDSINAQCFQMSHSGVCDSRRCLKFRLTFFKIKCYLISCLMYQKQHGWSNVNFEEGKSTLQALISLKCFNHWQFLLFHTMFLIKDNSQCFKWKSITYVYCSCRYWWNTQIVGDGVVKMVNYIYPRNHFSCHLLSGSGKVTGI